jgi:predicted Fe-S protein YdhL (DUF1289 family)
MPVPSPCIQVCVIDPLSGLCEGCGRSLAEIGRWAAMSDEDQRKLLKLLAPRLRALRGRLREESES